MGMSDTGTVSRMDEVGWGARAGLPAFHGSPPMVW
jgi:hypothetical protein